MERTPRPEKVAVVEEVRERFENSAAVLLTEYRGISVSAMGTLRRSLREAGGEYKIYKNTLVKLAVADLGVDGLVELMVGPTALAFVEDDAAAVAKALKDFKGINEHLVIKGAVLGGDLISEAQVMALANLPSRDQLLAKFAGGLQAPMSQFAALLNATVSKFAYLMQALIEDGGGPDAPPSEPAPAVSDDAVSDDAVSEEAVSEEAVSEEAVSEEAASDDAVSEEAVSEDAVSEDPASEEPAVATDESIPAEASADEDPTEES